MSADAPTSIDAIDAIDAIDKALVAATPRLSAEEQLLAASLYRLLAHGEPVSVNDAAAQAGVPSAKAADLVRSWPAVVMDYGGRIVGFWGLALNEMPHRLRLHGVELGAWCAWDPLFLARIIGDLEVATNDPITGETISYRIGADGEVTGLSHPETALSFLRPDIMWDDRMMETFCHHIVQFSSHVTAETWTKSHAGAFVIEWDDARELGRRHASRIGIVSEVSESHANFD